MWKLVGTYCDFVMMTNWLERAYSRMQSWLTVLVVALLAVGCKTQPPLKIDEVKESEVQTDQRTETDTDKQGTVQVDMDQIFQSWEEKLTEITGNWQRDEFSPPDSTGNQYKTSTTTGSIGSTSREQRRDSLVVNVDLSAVQTEITRVNEHITRLEKTVSNLQAERKAAISWWQAALMWLGGIFVGIVIMKIIWRKLP